MTGLVFHKQNCGHLEIVLPELQGFSAVNGIIPHLMLRILVFFDWGGLRKKIMRRNTPAEPQAL